MKELDEFDEYSYTDLPQYWNDEWNKSFNFKVYRSDMSLVLVVDFSEIKIKNENEAIINSIRDQALSLIDWFKFKNDLLPLFCIVFCTQETQDVLKKTSGNQEWLRGEFSMLITTLKDKIADFLKLLLNESFDTIQEVASLEDNEIGNRILKKAKEITKSEDQDKKDLLLEIANALKQDELLNTLENFHQKIIKEYESVKESS